MVVQWLCRGQRNPMGEAYRKKAISLPVCLQNTFAWFLLMTSFACTQQGQSIVAVCRSPPNLTHEPRMRWFGGGLAVVFFWPFAPANLATMRQRKALHGTQTTHVGRRDMFLLLAPRAQGKHMARRA